MSDGLLSYTEAAARLGVSRKTLATWIESGHVHAHTGIRRVPAAEIERLLSPATPTRCAWCEGPQDDGPPVSHGICPECAARVREEARR